jgi:tRNA G46 methylase TrmB
MNDAKQKVNRIQQNYDDYPYYSFPYERSAPEHLAAVAHVFGLSAPDPRTARVLELGCASGGNLIPFAVRNPDARALGVDISGVQIEEGCRRVERLKLKNVELRRQDLTTLGKRLDRSTTSCVTACIAGCPSLSVRRSCASAARICRQTALRISATKRIRDGSPARSCAMRC